MLSEAQQGTQAGMDGHVGVSQVTTARRRDCADPLPPVAAHPREDRWRNTRRRRRESRRSGSSGPSTPRSRSSEPIRPPPTTTEATSKARRPSASWVEG
eukprot:scaffold229020_cov31-Tisochrysis_lutea.AAC.2